MNRICLGECWLRPGVGKIRNQAQTLFPKLSQIVRQTNELQVIVEMLENNLPRLLDALAEYTTDEEISGKYFCVFNIVIRLLSPLEQFERTEAQTATRTLNYQVDFVFSTNNFIKKN